MGLLPESVDKPDTDIFDDDSNARNHKGACMEIFTLKYDIAAIKYK